MASTAPVCPLSPLHSPQPQPRVVNWYRTRRLNYLDELQLPSPSQIKIPVLFIAAARDNVLTPALSAGMEDDIPLLTRKEVDAGHWALWQAPGAVNGLMREWVEGVVFGGGSKL